MAFESLARGAPHGMVPAEPVVYLATKAQDMGAFGSYMTPADLQRVSGIDFSAYAVVAVFAGAQGASGHEVEVQSLRLSAGELSIIARISSPAPGGYGLTVFVTPYHAVAVPTKALGGVPPASWAIHDPQGKKTAGGRF